MIVMMMLLTCIALVNLLPFVKIIPPKVHFFVTLPTTASSSRHKHNLIIIEAMHTAPDSPFFGDLDETITNLAEPDYVSPPGTPCFAPKKLDFEEEAMDGVQTAVLNATKRKVSRDRGQTRLTEDIMDDESDDESPPPVVLSKADEADILKELDEVVEFDKTDYLRVAKVDAPSRKRKANDLYPTACAAFYNGHTANGRGMMCRPDTSLEPRLELTACSTQEMLAHPASLFIGHHAYYMWPGGFWAPLLIYRSIPRTFLHEKWVSDGRPYAVSPHATRTCGDMYVVTDPHTLAKYFAHMLVIYGLVDVRHKYVEQYGQTCAIIENTDARSDFSKLNFAKWRVSGKLNPEYGHYYAYHAVGKGTSVSKIKIDRPLFGRLVNGSTGKLLSVHDIRPEFFQFGFN